MRFTKIAGVAAGGLIVGALSVPMLATSAQAAVTNTVNPTFTCGTGTQASTWAPAVKLTVGHYQGTKTKITATYPKMANGAPVLYVNHPDATISSTLTISIGGTDVLLTGSGTSDFIGGTETKMPATSVVVDARPTAFDVKSFSYKAFKSADNGGTQITSQDCAIPAAIPVTVAAEPQLEGINAMCSIDMTESGFGGLESYGAKVEATATVPATGVAGKTISVPSTAKITFAREFSDYLASSPVYKATGSLTPQVEVGTDKATGAVALSTWNRTLNSAIPTPIGQAVTEFVSLEGAGTASVKLGSTGTKTSQLTGLKGDLSMTVTFGDTTMAAPVDCVLATPIATGTTKVAAPPVVIVAPVAKATTSKTTAAYKKKKKSATITTTVKAGAVSATGAIQVVVKVGKKQVAKATVALKSGKATLVLKKAKLKKKGKYTVKTTYAGNASFKASTSTKTFRVK